MGHMSHTYIWTHIGTVIVAATWLTGSLSRMDFVFYVIYIITIVSDRLLVAPGICVCVYYI
jgi:hypothetical protein